MNKNPSLQYEKLVLRSIKNISSPRTRDIVNARFGLVDGKRQTLELIGAKYGITRERVRQIVNAVLFDLKKSETSDILKPAFKSINNYFDRQGNVVREERLLSELTNIQEPHSERGSLFFILTLENPYQRFVESNKLYPVWSNSKTALNKSSNFIDLIVKDLEKNQKPVSLDYIINLASKNKMKLDNSAVKSYLDAAKQIDSNNLGQYGLYKWSEINPRGVKDKAYIIFKEQNNPLHFREVANLINQSNLGPALAQPQTVHNELIKDSRFVLVGRGTYALKEWGYEPGTVREVIINTLKQENPLSKESIVDKVLKTRLVKKNTVLINLQNKNYFIKMQDGKYGLK